MTIHITDTLSLLDFETWLTVLIFWYNFVLGSISLRHKFYKNDTLCDSWKYAILHQCYIIYIINLPSVLAENIFPQSKTCTALTVHIVTLDISCWTLAYTHTHMHMCKHQTHTTCTCSHITHTQAHSHVHTQTCVHFMCTLHFQWSEFLCMHAVYIVMFV
jgi:hypothetical protein